jgi:hypothetical protein
MFGRYLLVLALIFSASAFAADAGPRNPNRHNPAPLSIPVYDVTTDAWSGLVAQATADWNAALAATGEDRLVYQRRTVQPCGIPTDYGITICESNHLGAQMSRFDPGVVGIQLYDHTLYTPYLGVVCHEMTHIITMKFDHWPSDVASCIGDNRTEHPTELDISNVDLSWFSPYYRESKGQGPDRTNGPHDTLVNKEGKKHQGKKR